MKRYINYSIMLVLTLGVFAACESDPVMFDSSKSFVAFENKTANVQESPEEAVVEIPVTVGAVPGSSEVTVDFEIIDDSTAIEGEDFEIENNSRSLTFDKGFGTEYIIVKAIDNGEFSGNKIFTVNITGNSVNYPAGSVSSLTVTVVDDEHPLAKWIGTYSVEALSYWSPGEYDETWGNVQTKPNPEDVNTLLISGIGGGTKEIVATFDVEEMTISIKPGANVGDAYGYGDVLMYHGSNELVVDEAATMIGEISEDGSIHIDLIGMVLTGANEGYVWDVFDTYWTKQ
jgi:hypothetical protein